MRAAPRVRGFTLIELMIVLVIIGILLAFALPAYQDLVLKSKVRTAQADLAALAMNAENFLQRRLSYYTAALGDTAAIRAQFPGWSPAQDADFSFSYSPILSGTVVTGYALQATWISPNLRLAGCVVALNSLNAKTMSNDCNPVMGGATTW